MAELKCYFEDEIDTITVLGTWADNDVFDFAQLISTLRQQGCTRLLILGGEIEHISVKKWDPMLGTVRVFRSLGGVIALADFHQAHAAVIKNSPWQRYINLFQTKEEAIRFLQP